MNISSPHVLENISIGKILTYSGVKECAANNVPVYYYITDPDERLKSSNFRSHSTALKGIVKGVTSVSLLADQRAWIPGLGILPKWLKDDTCLSAISHRGTLVSLFSLHTTPTILVQYQDKTFIVLPEVAAEVNKDYCVCFQATGPDRIMKVKRDFIQRDDVVILNSQCSLKDHVLRDIIRGVSNISNCFPAMWQTEWKDSYNKKRSKAAKKLEEYPPHIIEYVSANPRELQAEEVPF